MSYESVVDNLQKLNKDLLVLRKVMKQIVKTDDLCSTLSFTVGVQADIGFIEDALSLTLENFMETYSDKNVTLDMINVLDTFCWDYIQLDSKSYPYSKLKQDLKSCFEELL